MQASEAVEKLRFSNSLRSKPRFRSSIPAAARALTGTLAVGLYKNPRTCRGFLWFSPQAAKTCLKRAAARRTFLTSCAPAASPRGLFSYGPAPAQLAQAQGGLQCGRGAERLHGQRPAVRRNVDCAQPRDPVQAAAHRLPVRPPGAPEMKLHNRPPFPRISIASVCPAHLPFIPPCHRLCGVI